MIFVFLVRLYRLTTNTHSSGNRRVLMVVVMKIQTVVAVKAKFLSLWQFFFSFLFSLLIFVVNTLQNTSLPGISTENLGDQTAQKINNKTSDLTGNTLETEQFQTYITGNTLGKTTDASARYSYKILVSFSSVVLRTSVA